MSTHWLSHAFNPPARDSNPERIPPPASACLLGLVAAAAAGISSSETPTELSLAVNPSAVMMKTPKTLSLPARRSAGRGAHGYPDSVRCHCHARPTAPPRPPHGPACIPEPNTWDRPPAAGRPKLVAQGPRRPPGQIKKRRCGTCAACNPENDASCKLDQSRGERLTEHMTEQKTKTI